MSDDELRQRHRSITFVSLACIHGCLVGATAVSVTDEYWFLRPLVLAVYAAGAWLLISRCFVERQGGRP